jgi:hypothetical protein
MCANEGLCSCSLTSRWGRRRFLQLDFFSPSATAGCSTPAPPLAVRISQHAGSGWLGPLDRTQPREGDVPGFGLSRTRGDTEGPDKGRRKRAAAGRRQGARALLAPSLLCGVIRSLRVKGVSALSQAEAQTLGHSAVPSKTFYTAS